MSNVGKRMPIFEFTCDDCRLDFDELVNHDQLSSVACPKCGRRKVSRKLSVFAARSGAQESTPMQTGGCGRCGDPAGPCGM
jgi:putative FmdB family regulatory protein